jgi:hypothetical protein
MTLQERLKQPIKTVHEERQPDSVKVMWNLGDKTVQDLAQAIEKDILELIGEDDSLTPAMKVKGHYEDTIWSRNQLRRELRLKLKEYIGGSNG